MERLFKIVNLSDGQKVKVQELTGMDEMIAAKVVGNEMNKPGAGMLQMRAVLQAFSIVEINEKPVKRPGNLVEVQAFMGKFKMRDTSRIGKAFSKLNDDIEAEGETSAVELESIS